MGSSCSKREELQFGMVAANNDYAGFGPATSNTMRGLIVSRSVGEEWKQDAIDGTLES